MTHKLEADIERIAKLRHKKWWLALCLLGPFFIHIIPYIPDDETTISYKAFEFATYISYMPVFAGPIAFALAVCGLGEARCNGSPVFGGSLPTLFRKLREIYFGTVIIPCLGAILGVESFFLTHVPLDRIDALHLKVPLIYLTGSLLFGLAFYPVGLAASTMNSRIRKPGGTALARWWQQLTRKS